MSTYTEVSECCLATVMTAHFPVWMFFLAQRQAFVSPTSLLYLPAKPFMDNAGGLSVVLLRDKCSKEKESVQVLPRGPSMAACMLCEKVCKGLDGFKDAS